MSQMYRAYFDDGALRAEGVLVDGLPHGVQREWHANGVLAKETPCVGGRIDGVVRQWNQRGELVAESRLVGGTGVLKLLFPEQGTEGEMTYVDGELTGRQRGFCGGELIVTVFWIRNKKVSRKAYLSACELDPALPVYSDEHKAQTGGGKGKKQVKSKKAARGGAQDAMEMALLKGAGVREALEWLTEPQARSLGEATSREDSIELVKALYAAGAVAVHAVEIQGEAELDQNTGKLVIQLPVDAAGRERVFEFCRPIAQEMGFDGEEDQGQRYLFLGLD